jgi:hypothetical protein
VLGNTLLSRDGWTARLRCSRCLLLAAYMEKKFPNNLFSTLSHITTYSTTACNWVIRASASNFSRDLQSATALWQIVSCTIRMEIPASVPWCGLMQMFTGYSLWYTRQTERARWPDGVLVWRGVLDSPRAEKMPWPSLPTTTRYASPRTHLHADR